MTLAYEPDANAAPPAIVALMQRHGLRMAYAKDEEIFAQDEDAGLVHLLASGTVRTTRLLSDGRRQIGAFYYPGDLIGPETGAIHRFSAEAISDCTVLVVRRAGLKPAVSDGEFDRALWEATRCELERTQDHLLVLGCKNACERVASFLMSLARRAPGERVSVPMTRQDIADYLGLTIETVSRMLTQLQKDSVIEFDGLRRFKVKRWQALEAMAA